MKTGMQETIMTSSAEQKHGFKKLLVWEKAYQLALGIHRVSDAFPKHEIYGLTAQLRRSAISVSANIAEGYERRHRKEYLQHLMIAKGSLAEADTFLYFARDVKYLSDDLFLNLQKQLREVARMLEGLARSLRTVSEREKNT